MSSESSPVVDPKNEGPAHEGADSENQGRCTLPPEGWYCSLDHGHEGPCCTAREIIPMLSQDLPTHSYGVSVRAVDLDHPVYRTTFDVIVNCGLGRKNAEAVARRIRAALDPVVDSRSLFPKEVALKSVAVPAIETPELQGALERLLDWQLSLTEEPAVGMTRYSVGQCADDAFAVITELSRVLEERDSARNQLDNLSSDYGNIVGENVEFKQAMTALRSERDLAVANSLSQCPNCGSKNA